MKTQQRLHRLHAHEALLTYRRGKRKGEKVSISSIAREFDISPRALQRRNRTKEPRVQQNKDGNITDEDMTSLGADIQTPTSAEELQFDIVQEYMTRHEEELGPLCSPMRMILSAGSRVISYFRGPIPPLQPPHYDSPDEYWTCMTEQWVHNFVRKYPQYAKYKKEMLEEVIVNDGGLRYSSDVSARTSL